MTNLCEMSGKTSTNNNEFSYWGVTNAEIVKIVCPMCMSLVSLNPTSNLIRKHRA